MPEQEDRPQQQQQQTMVAMTNEQFDMFMDFVRGRFNGGSEEVGQEKAAGENGQESRDLVPVSTALYVLESLPLNDPSASASLPNNPNSEKPVNEDSLEKTAEPETVPKQRRSSVTFNFDKSTLRSRDLVDGRPVLGRDGIERSARETSRELYLTESERLQRLVTALNEDTFSFVISAPVMSAPFATGILIFLIKVILYGLTLADLMNLAGNGDLATNIPVGIEPLVMYTQLLALCVAVMTQNDMIGALRLLYEGFGRNTDGAGIDDTFPYSSFPTWVCAITLMFFGGLLGLLATLYLTITSTTILDVLLNFAAVEFIASLDDSAFFLASIGYLGKYNRLEAEVIANTTYRVPHKVQPIYQIALLLCILAATIGGWLTVVVLQFTGSFAPGSFYVQFDDQIRRELGTHSGIYVLQSRSLSFTNFFNNRGRFPYREQRGGIGRFDYCYNINAWTFFVEGNDPCAEVIAMADPLNTFDITETAASTWVVLKGDQSTFVPLSHFHLTTICSVDDDCNGNGVCNGNGFCDCDDRFLGPNCEFDFDKLCAHLELSSLFSQEFIARRSLATTYDLLGANDTSEPIFSSYDRPVYFNNETQDTIFYSGLRWVVGNPQYGGFSGGQQNMTSAEIFAFLRSESVHGSTDIGQVDAVSDPVFYGSVQDSSIPVDRDWFAVLDNANFTEALISPNKIDATLTCFICDSKVNPCANNNQCIDGTCICENGERGNLCEIFPTGDGVCNPFFNTPVYDYDGGDCCAFTCSSSIATCGSMAFENGPLSGVGYPLCARPSLVGHCGDDQRCYVRHTTTLPPFFPPPSYTSALGTWNNGKVVAVGEQGGISSILIARDVNAVVNQVGDTIELGPDVFRMAVASPPGIIDRTNAGTVPRGMVAFSQGIDDIAVAYVGAVTSGYAYQFPIGFEDFGVQISQQCNKLRKIDIGYQLSNSLGSAALVAATVAVLLDRGCVSGLPNNVSDSNAFAFVQENLNRRWNMVPLGLWDDVSLSGSGGVVALHDSTNGIGANVSLAVGAQIHVSFSLRDVLAAKLRSNISTVFTSLETMQLSRTGRVLSVALMANDTATGETFGIVARISAGTESDFMSRSVDPASVVPISYLDTFPALSGIPGQYCAQPNACDRIVFSGDGASFAVLSTNGVEGDTGDGSIDVYTTHKNYGVSYGQWTQLASFDPQHHQISRVRKFALTHDGSALMVSGREGAVHFELREKCASTEVPVHVSMELDSQPQSVSWEIHRILRVNNRTYTRSILQECSGCYRFSDDYAQSTVVERVCLPQRIAPCIGMSAEQQTTATTGISYFVFFRGGSQILPTVQGTGAQIPGFGFARTWEPNITACPNIVVPDCAVGESLYVQGVTFGKLDGTMTWAIRSNTTGVELNRRTVGRGDLDPDDSSILDEICVPSQDCWILALTGSSFSVSYVLAVLDGTMLPWSGPQPVEVQLGGREMWFGSC